MRICSTQRCGSRQRKPRSGKAPTRLRPALWAYAAISGVRPDFAVYGKAIANGYPMAMLGGRRDYMDWFVHPDPAKRVLLAGTYNAHPVPTAATIATVRKLLANDGEVYRRTEALGARMEAGLRAVITNRPVHIARQGSAFCIYFMDHLPVDWHDLAGHHDFATDDRMRQSLIEKGVYFFPIAIKQCSISFAHTEAQIDRTIEAVGEALQS